MADTDRGTSLRRGVLALSAIAALVGLFWIGRSFSVGGKLRFGNPPQAGASELPDASPRQLRAEVTRVQGAAVARPGDKCEFLVERRRREPDSYWCNAQVVCGGRLLYGGPDRGYFPCKLYDDGEQRDVIGSDPHTTASDKDAAIAINSRESVMRIWDDDRGVLGEFVVEAEILSIQ
ncbi:MAG TPA: hypothetical protein VFX59_20595 [Polyangiales bacterium]|nr:hypothetical protein [Polyangiales bacterium]